MRESPPALLAPIDVGLGGVLLANMLVGWLDADPKLLPTGEAADESQDYRTPPQQTSLGVCSSVDASTSPPASREHGTPVCPARESAGTGLERADDPHSRPGSGDVGSTDNGAGRLQDPGSGGLDGSGGGGVCLGGLAAGALECRLASIDFPLNRDIHLGLPELLTLACDGGECSTRSARRFKKSTYIRPA